MLNGRRDPSGQLKDVTLTVTVADEVAKAPLFQAPGVDKDERCMLPTASGLA